MKDIAIAILIIILGILMILYLIPFEILGFFWGLSKNGIRHGEERLDKFLDWATTQRLKL